MLLDKRIPVSYIFKSIQDELLIVMIVYFFVHYFTVVFHEVIPEMSIAIPAFIGTAISIIQSFKLNQTYDRWWEARKIWGSIVNDSRTFILQLQSFVERGNESDIQTMAYRQIAWCYSLSQSLRGLNPVQGLQRFLSKEDFKQLESHDNKPLKILQQNTIHLANLRRDEQLNVFYHTQLTGTIASFSNWMGMAERIKGTVFPVSYQYFLRWVIYLFIITISIALKDVEIYYELPLLMAISCVFFLLEKTSTHLQDPFSNEPTDTAMTAISTKIEINIKQLINDSNLPVEKPHDDFYVL